MTILLLEDKLGITDAYKPAWTNLLMQARINPKSIAYRSVWRDPKLLNIRSKLLIRKGNRNSPGFNPDGLVQRTLSTWLQTQIKATGAKLVLCMDLALLGLLDSEWNNATIDNLRGGVYRWHGVPVLVMTPISAIHTQKKLKDIQALNEGAGSKEEFAARQIDLGDAEDDESEPVTDDKEEKFFIEPYVIPYGIIILRFDIRKAYRVYANETQIEQVSK